MPEHGDASGHAAWASRRRPGTSTRSSSNSAAPAAQWCDFVSYDPRLPENMRLFVRRVCRDDKRIAELEAEAVAFLGEIDARITQLENLYGEKAAA